MLSETNRLDSYSSMKAKILSSYFGKLEDYNSQTSELDEDKTVMDLTYSTNTNNQDDRNVPSSQTYDSPSDVISDATNQSVLRVLPHHGLLLPPGPSNYRTVIQQHHIPSGQHLHPSAGIITVLPDHSTTGHSAANVTTGSSGVHISQLSRHHQQPSPNSIHSLESHPSASSSPSLNSDFYKGGGGGSGGGASGNYSGSEAGGSGISGLLVSSSRKKKKQPQPIPEECKDDAYWERRKRNNESAKRSREIRRMKERHTSIRVAFLEQENLQLRTEVNMLRDEVEKLRNLLCTKGSNNNGAAS